MVNDPAQEATVWGENADPDVDGRTNLYEYTMNTDPRQSTVDPVVWDYGQSIALGKLAVRYSVRAADASLIVFPQYSEDAQTWWPLPPRDTFSWMGDGRWFWAASTSEAINGMRLVTQVCAQPMASAPRMFSHLVAMRNQARAIGSPLENEGKFSST